LRFSETASTNTRLKLLSEGISLVRTYPIFGVGLLNTRFFTFDLIGNNYIHNTYLEVFVELGIAGGLLYIGMFILLIHEKSKNHFAFLIKIVIMTQMSMIFFISATNNEILFFTFALFNITNRGIENVYKTYFV
jgi:O-antigen ligase